MAGFAYLAAQNNVLRSPRQAANVFSQLQPGLPKQRHVFIARFISPISATSNLTFVVKSIERPKVNPKVEELNEYNKRRQILTGYKLEPVRMQFYDGADNAALNMWIAYARYYYGDLNNQAGTTPGQSGTGNPSYAYDATSPTFNDPTQSGFGFTARNNGSAVNDNQFFFDRIEIYQFYDGKYDLYYLIHPRIQSFEPDDLDYAETAASVINLAVAYENLQYFPQQSVSTQFEEFQNQFFGDPVIPAGSVSAAATNPQPTNTLTPTLPDIPSLLSNPTGAVSSLANYRYNSVPSSGALGLYGNYGFGPTGVNSAALSLSTMALGNPALSVALNMGTSAAGSGSISASTWDGVAASVEPTASGYGTVAQTVAGGALASLAIGSIAPISNAAGLALTASAFGAINAQQTGTAQYGFNFNTDNAGDSWGYNGPTGFVGPADDVLV